MGGRYNQLKLLTIANNCLQSIQVYRGKQRQQNRKLLKQLLHAQKSKTWMWVSKRNISKQIKQMQAIKRLCIVHSLILASYYEYVGIVDRLLLIVRAGSIYIIMGRKVVLKTIMAKSSAILPLTINTLYNEDAEDLNNIPERCNVISNMIGIRHKLQRLRLTAAEAQCAALASNQVFLTEKMFVVHKNANAIGKWISQQYKQPKDYDCFINAQLIQADHPTVVNQESVSFPFLNADIHRFKNIHVSYVDFEGTKKQEQIDGFKSFAFQQAWDYSFGRHIVDWRLHNGTLKVQDNVQKNLPKLTSVLEQYNQELKSLTQKYPKMFAVPQKIEQSQIGWFANRGGQEISIESDYVSRIHKHYRKEMLIFLEKLSLNLV